MNFNIQFLFYFFYFHPSPSVLPSPPPLKLNDRFSCLEVQRSKLLRRVLKAAACNVGMDLFFFYVCARQHQRSASFEKSEAFCPTLSNELLVSSRATFKKQLARFHYNLGGRLV